MSIEFIAFWGFVAWVISLFRNIFGLRDSSSFVNFVNKLSRRYLKTTFFTDTASTENITFKKPKSNLKNRPHFVGRKDKLSTILAYLRTPMASIAIVGPGGVGKTTLALKACQIMQESNPALICCFITTATSPLSYGDILDKILKICNLDLAFSSSENNKRNLIINTAQKYEMIFIFDSYENIDKDLDLSQFITDLANVSRVLITTKRIINTNDSQSAFYNSIHYEKLDNFKDPEAEIFFRELNAEFGNKLSQSLTDSAINKIATAAGGNALAFQWVITQLCQGRSISSVIQDIEDGEGSTHERLFSSIWPTLTGSQRCIMLALSQFAASPSAEQLQSVVNGGGKFKKNIAKLSSLYLIDEFDDSGTVRFELHPLTLSFIKKVFPKTHRKYIKLYNRYVKYFFNYSQRYGGNEWNWNNFNLLEAELTNIWACFQYLLKSKQYYDILTMRDQLSLFLSIRGHWLKCIELAKATRDAATHLLSHELQYAWSTVYDYAYTELKLGNTKQAKKLVLEGLRIFERKKDILGIATSKRHLGRIAQINKDYISANNLYEESKNLYVSQDDEYLPFLLWDLGDLAFDMHNLKEAEQYFKQAYDLSKAKKGKNESSQAMAARSLGEVYFYNNDTKNAEIYLLEAQQISTLIGRADEVAISNLQLARLYKKINNTEKLHKSAEKAQAVFTQLGDKTAEDELKQLLEANI